MPNILSIMGYKYSGEKEIITEGRKSDMKTKWKIKIIGFIACLAMFAGSTLCVSAEPYVYQEADGTWITEEIIQEADGTWITKKIIDDGMTLRTEVIIKDGMSPIVKEDGSVEWVINFDSGKNIVTEKEDDGRYTYYKADGTYEIREGAKPMTGENGLPTYIMEYSNSVKEVYALTPNGVYIYDGYWSDFYTPEQIAILYAAIDAAGITNGMPKYDKAVAINNWVCAAMTYDHDGAGGTATAPHQDGLIAIQMGGKGVCGEYADLFKTMCQAVGVDCDKVCGFVDSVPHAWDVVAIDGKEYFVDPTWNDTENNPNRYLMSETPLERHKEWYRQSANANEQFVAWFRTEMTKRNWTPEDYGKNWAYDSDWGYYVK